MDMKSISQKLQDDIRAIMEAGLHPNQQKINVHEPEKDKITAHDFKKLRTMKKTPDGKVHNCATHVEHVVLGKGTTVSEQHAEPDANGNIEWYTVQFENSVQKVLTKDLTITMSEAHMHESSEEQFDEEEKKKVVSPFDYKNYKSEIPKKPGELTGHDSKKISTGTVYTKKPVKEESHQSKTTMKHIPDASPAMKKAAKDIKPGIAGYRDRVAMLKAGGVKEEFEQLDEIGDTPAGMEKVKAYRAAVGRQYHKTGEYDTRLSDADRKPNPFHAKDAASMPNAANKRYSRQTGAARAKKIETGTRYEEAQIDELSVNTLNRVHTAAVRDANDASRDGDEARADKRYNLAGKASNKAELKNRAAGLKPSGQHALESVEQEEYTFADYLEAARAQYVDEDAVLVANEAFKNKDITLFIYQSQSPEA